MLIVLLVQKIIKTLTGTNVLLVLYDILKTHWRLNIFKIYITLITLCNSMFTCYYCFHFTKLRIKTNIYFIFIIILYQN